jgi:hypothetical protein
VFAGRLKQGSWSRLPDHSEFFDQNVKDKTNIRYHQACLHDLRKLCVLNLIESFFDKSI